MYIKNIVNLPLIIITTIVLMFYTFKWSIIQYDLYKLEQFTIETTAEVTKLAKKTLKPINMEHLKCLATNIYHEAGSEPLMGQVAVARVVMNRIKHGFGNNPCKVIYQANLVPDTENETYKKVCQFSWVCEGKTTPVRNITYINAEKIARQVLLENKWKDDIPNNILFFHNTTVNPGWNYKQVMTIGNHIFYSKK